MRNAECGIKNAAVHSTLALHSSFIIHHFGSNFFLGRKLPRLLLEHHRNVVLDRITETARPADELLVRLAVDERALAQGTHEQIEQARVHGRSFRRTSSPSSGSGAALTGSTQCFSDANGAHFTASFSVITTASAAGK